MLAPRMSRAHSGIPVIKRNKMASAAGEQLKALRRRLGMTTRQVERFSQQVADTKNNPEFYISHAWLTNIETGEFTPSIYKLYTLSAIYRYKFADLLGFFGLRLDGMTKDILSIRLPTTHLIGKAAALEGESLSLPTHFAPVFHLPLTSPLPPLLKTTTKPPCP